MSSCRITPVDSTVGVNMILVRTGIYIIHQRQRSTREIKTVAIRLVANMYGDFRLFDSVATRTKTLSTRALIRAMGQ